MESGSIASWNLKEGDSFSAGDVFCSVETDKATVDFEAQDDGVVAKILVPAGPADLKVGYPIMVTTESKDDVASFSDFLVTGAQGTAPAGDAPPPPAPAPTATTPSSAVMVPAPSTSPDPSPAAATSSGGRVVASPLAHTLAKELGRDLSMISGSGPGGRVIAADVREFVPPVLAAAPVAAVDSPASTGVTKTAPPAPAQVVMASAPPIVGSGYTDYPLSDQAREAAARLAQAKRNVPHYYLTVDVSVDELLSLRERLNATFTEDDDKLGVYEFLLKATAMSMKTVPSANGSWMDSVVRVYDSVDLNVVVGSGDSLSTPVLRNCAAVGLKQISKELKAAVSATPVNSEVGTFTVMNLGMYGVKSCAPIIREPQSCSLAIGALENRIVPNDDPDSEEMYKESIAFTATLSCDHRVVDGAVGAQWLASFKAHVENPTTLLL